MARNDGFGEHMKCNFDGKDQKHFNNVIWLAIYDSNTTCLFFQASAVENNLL